MVIKEFMAFLLSQDTFVLHIPHVSKKNIGNSDSVYTIGCVSSRNTLYSKKKKVVQFNVWARPRARSSHKVTKCLKIKKKVNQKLSIKAIKSNFFFENYSKHVRKKRQQKI